MEDVERLACSLLSEIRDLQESGEVAPDLYYFGRLHDQMDANVGWATVPDDLDVEVWSRITDRVSELLCEAMGLCTGSATRWPEFVCGKCGHGTEVDKYGYANAHTPDGVTVPNEADKETDR